MEMQIDFSKPELLSQYGLTVQKNLAHFSEKILTDVKNKDTAEIGNLLNELMLTVKGLDLDKMANPGVLMKLWHKILSEVSLFKGSFEKVTDQLDLLVKELEGAKADLILNTKHLEYTYQQNLTYYHELEKLIVNAEREIERRKKELSRIEMKNGDLIEVQKVKDQKYFLHEFEKRIHDLRLTKTMTLQTLPQIRIIQHNNNELVNKIQSSILNTIPIWKNQIVLALSLEKQKKVAEIQSKIFETTNAMIQKNSSLLKENSITVAKLTEQGIIESSTLQKVNEDLISIISEVIRTFQDGRSKRQEAEKELSQMEDRLKTSLASVI